MYATYIRTTPEQLWKGLTDPVFTRRYWNISFDTDWEAGSEMVWDHHGVRLEDPEQVVLEATPFTTCPTPGTTSHPSWERRWGSAKIRRRR